MRAILVSADDGLRGELATAIESARLGCDLVPTSTFAGACLILETVRPAVLFVEQQQAISDAGGFSALMTQVGQRAAVVAVGGNARWAAHSDVTQVLPRPIAASQLTLAVDAARFRRPDLKHAPTPSLPAEAIEPLIAEASELLGRPATLQMAREFRDAPGDARRWHPWAPAFDWILRAKPRGGIPPFASSVARDMTFLKAIPDVLDGQLRKRVRARLLAEGDAALQEITIAGGSILLGQDAEWTDVTGRDKADVLIRKPGPVEVQVKTRRRQSGNPMEPLPTLYKRLHDAAAQTTPGRIAMVVLVVPGAPEWKAWQDTVAGKEFLIHTRDVLFREPRFAEIPVIVLASGLLTSGTASSQSIYQSAWVIHNTASCEKALPEDLGIFTSEPISAT